jgi:hypothetical protein
MQDSRVPYEVGSQEYGSGTRVQYPNPFFDLASNFVPSNIKSLFRYCRGFYYTNGFIRNIITKLTEYPITDILFETELDRDTKEKYSNILKYQIKLKQLLVEIGLDYYTFGNAFISANLKFKRYLTCTSCNESFPIDRHESSWKFKNFEFHGKCPTCGADNSPFKIEDKHIPGVDSLKFIRWAPEQIEIDYDELTGDTSYFYKISNDKKKKIIAGNKKVVARTPKIFLQSLKEKKLIQLDNSNLYHFKRPTLAEENMGWGKPAILPAMKDLYYLQTLRRGNEAVANEHIVPKKAIYPASNGTIDPFQSMNLGKWRGQIEEQISKWKRDPNHIGVFPIPIGYQQLGGDAKMLMLAPELKFTEENIIVNMGMPIDFIKGGASWTGSSVSLRIVENHFLPYREMLLDFINFFVVNRLHALLGLPKVKVSLKDLKMTDDSETKQIMLNMREGRQISHKTLLDKFGLDYYKEQDFIKKEDKDRVESSKAEHIAMALAQGTAQETLARHEARAQHALQDEAHRLREEPFEANVLAENANLYLDSSKLIEMLSIQLSMTPPDQQQALYEALATQAPVTAALVLERFLSSGQQGGGAMPMQAGVLDGPGAGAPEKPNKKENQVEPKGDKQRGQTRGTV